MAVFEIADEPKRCKIPIRDKFAVEGDLWRLQAAIGELPEHVAKATRFSADLPNGIPGKLMLLTNVSVHTDCKYVPQVSAAITTAGFKIRTSNPPEPTPLIMTVEQFQSLISGQVMEAIREKIWAGVPVLVREKPGEQPRYRVRERGGRNGEFELEELKTD